MLENFDSLLHKMRYIFVGALIIASLLFLILLITSAATTQSPANDDGATISMYDGPNAVTSGMSAMAASADNALTNANHRAVNGFRGIGNTMQKTGKFIASTSTAAGKAAAHGLARTGAAIGHTLGKGVIYGARGLVSGMGFIADTTNGVVGLVAYNPIMNTVTRPADNMSMPTIDPRSPALLAATAAMPAVQAVAQAQQPATPKADDTAAWPIHGEITTYFGASDWPYQTHHTGIDISDGFRSGVTPVHPYRPGRVIQVVHSSTGLGNHVVIDHGAGITSVYGHMSSTTVQEGQEVNGNTTLGLEGSTGASTGPHVHFEIRLNGAPVNPIDYIPGRP
jgi:murein DD-endopeptidase MepM/ murein hydrolase activator NlpD